VLAKDGVVASCLRMGDMSQDQLPASWFVASRIQLDGSGESDLVVQASGIIDGPTAPGPLTCFLKPYATHFWVIRESSFGYSLVFSASGRKLKTLNSRTNGLLDLQLVRLTTTGEPLDNKVYKFDGQGYQAQRAKTAHP